ncbi:MAG: hypothetical protein H6633_23885 [Anaerolineales bacterium]|nr:hypothetical protein [Anaerolineales bacterium]
MPPFNEINQYDLIFIDAITKGRPVLHNIAALKPEAALCNIAGSSHVHHKVDHAGHFVHHYMY